MSTSDREPTSNGGRAVGWVAGIVLVAVGVTAARVAAGGNDIESVDFSKGSALVTYRNDRGDLVEGAKLSVRCERGKVAVSKIPLGTTAVVQWDKELAGQPNPCDGDAVITKTERTQVVQIAELMRDDFERK